jgi:hypothetical protein
VGLDGFVGTIPASLVTGNIQYHLEALDNEGQRRREPSNVNASFTVIVDTRPDDPPKITHSLPSSIGAGDDLALAATVRDEFGVAGVWVRFRQVGKTDFAQMEMRRSGGDDYGATVPGRFVEPPGVEYYILAIDDALQSAAHPTDAPVAGIHKIEVYPTADPLQIFEMRLGGLLPLWSILLLVLVLVAIAAAGAAAKARRDLKARKSQLPWAAAQASASGAQKGRKGEQTEATGKPPDQAQTVRPAGPLSGGTPGPQGAQPPGPQAGPASTGLAPISRTSASLVTPESEWGFPMGAEAGPQDTEPSLLPPGKRCGSCGMENFVESLWCAGCHASLGGAPR